MMSVDLLGLAERVEGLAGPDREVDFLIAELCVGPHEHWQGARARKRDPYNALWFSPNQETPVQHGWEWSQPAYTASLDAAMSLVPEGYRWCVDTCRDRPRSFVEPCHPYDGQPWWGNAATPTLALCAAALRARAAIGEGV